MFAAAAARPHSFRQRGHATKILLNSTPYLVDDRLTPVFKRDENLTAMRLDKIRTKFAQNLPQGFKGLFGSRMRW
jgi:hypothetical protein